MSSFPYRITCNPYNGELDASRVDYKSALFFENMIGIGDVEIQSKGRERKKKVGLRMHNSAVPHT
jgi:hypothetical protein